MLAPMHGKQLYLASATGVSKTISTDTRACQRLEECSNNLTQRLENESPDHLSYHCWSSTLLARERLGLDLTHSYPLSHQQKNGANAPSPVL